MSAKKISIVIILHIVLSPNRLELHADSGNTKPELLFMDSIEEVVPDLVPVKNEQCILIKSKDNKIIITNSVRNVRIVLLGICIHIFINPARVSPSGCPLLVTEQTRRRYMQKKGTSTSLI